MEWDSIQDKENQAKTHHNMWLQPHLIWKTDNLWKKRQSWKPVWPLLSFQWVTNTLKTRSPRYAKQGRVESTHSNSHIRTFWSECQKLSGLWILYINQHQLLRWQNITINSIPGVQNPVQPWAIKSSRTEGLIYLPGAPNDDKCVHLLQMCDRGKVSCSVRCSPMLFPS